MDQPQEHQSPPHVRVFNDPGLRDAVMVVAFEGWNDAGDAASGAVDHLINEFRLVPFAEIDSEEFFDFNETRPQVALTKTGSRHILWPNTEFYGGRSPDRTVEVVAVRGIEPHLKWRTFSQAIVETALRNNVSMVITVGALLADVPHSRPTIVYGSTDDPELGQRLDLKPSSYEGPTGIVGVLHSFCSGAGLATASLWATVPTYVPGATSPKATLALLERLTDMMSVHVDTSDLVLATAEYERDVDLLVADDDDTAAYVAELERNYDDGVEQTPMLLIQEVEQFLREQNG